MTTNTAIYTGNFETDGNWSLGVRPTIFDEAVIPTGITITSYDVNNAADHIIVQSGGKLGVGPGQGIIIGTYVSVEAGGSFISGGTAASPATLVGGGAGHWVFLLASPASDTVLDYLNLIGNNYSLGTLQFNDPAVALGPWINNATPLTRAPIIVNHSIDGRAYGRTYRRGSQAGVVTINGFLYRSAFTDQMIRAMQAANTGLSLTTDRTHLPWCSIDGEPRINSKAGQDWAPFSITLIEDR